MNKVYQGLFPAGVGCLLWCEFRIQSQGEELRFNLMAVTTNPLDALNAELAKAKCVAVAAYHIHMSCGPSSHNVSIELSGYASAWPWADWIT